MSAPVTRWGGPLILLALLKWRRADGRLLVALSCIPQTPVLYDVVPLFLLVRTFRDAALLIVLTGAVASIVDATARNASYNTWMAINGQWMVWLVYLPCTAMVLLRPNEGLTVDWRTLHLDAWRALWRRPATPATRPQTSATPRAARPRDSPMRRDGPA
jgi:hypothetical protein